MISFCGLDDGCTFMCCYVSLWPFISGLAGSNSWMFGGTLDNKASQRGTGRYILVIFLFTTFYFDLFIDG